jgi:DNA-binding transcriptional LysR family regulator
VDLVAKRIADIEISLFASKTYLETLGPLTGPEDFAHANFIGYQSPERLVPQITAMGFPVTKSNFGITTSNGSTMYELVRDGAGIAFLPTVVAEGRLGLQRILPDAPSFNMETWLVTHREIQTSRRIRITFDHLAKELGKDKWNSLIARS